MQNKLPRSFTSRVAALFVILMITTLVSACTNFANRETLSEPGGRTTANPGGGGGGAGGSGGSY